MAATTATTTTISNVSLTSVSASASAGGRKVPVAATSLPKIGEFRVMAASHMREWESKSELTRDVRDDDRSVERFLIARKFDVQAAFQMWLDAVKWRYEGKLDSVLHDAHPHLLDIRSSMDNHCEHKFDKFGRPIYIEWVGKLDVNKVLPKYNMDAVMEYQFHASEFRRKVLFARGSALSGQAVDQIVSIVDLKGIEFGKHLTKPVYEFIKKLSACNQAYYPEFLGALYIINAPTIFRLAWVVIRPWLDSRTQSKIQILSDDGRDQLLKIMSPESLPSFMGGTCQCHVTPLVRQCAGTSSTMIPKKVVSKAKSSKGTSTNEATTPSNEVIIDCANSSAEQLAYYTIALHGLAAYDRSLMPLAPSPSLSPFPLSPSLSMSPSDSSLNSVSTAMSPSSREYMVTAASPTSVSASSSLSSTPSTPTSQMSDSDAIHDVKINSNGYMMPSPSEPLPVNESTPSSKVILSNGSSVTSGAPSHVLLIPTPAPPILDEDEYEYDSYNMSNTNSNSKDQSKRPSTTPIISNGMTNAYKVENDDMELKQRADIPTYTNNTILNGGHDSDHSNSSSSNGVSPTSSSRRLRACGVPMNINCLQRIRGGAATQSTPTTTSTSPSPMPAPALAPTSSALAV